MITIDRSSSVSVQDQLVEQLRFQIASGRYKVEETLPSTRTLADQVGVSFHTVRKAYHQLQEEGLLESKVGSGFRVKARAPLSKEQRMEQGAAIIQEALQKLIGLGLQDAEVEYLMQEQMNLLEDRVVGYKLLFAAPYQEMAELCAEQVTMKLQQSVEPVPLDRLSHHHDADYVFTRCADLQRAMRTLPRVDMLGVVTYLAPDALEHVARMISHETLGLVTRYADAVPPLMAEIRTQTGFAGQVLGASIDDGARHLTQFIRQTNLLVYTPRSRRRLLPLLVDENRPHYLLTPIVSADSLEAIRQTVPA